MLGSGERSPVSHPASLVFSIEDGTALVCRHCTSKYTSLALTHPSCIHSRGVKMFLACLPSNQILQNLSTTYVCSKFMSCWTLGKVEHDWLVSPIEACGLVWYWFDTVALHIPSPSMAATSHTKPISEAIVVYSASKPITSL